MARISAGLKLGPLARHIEPAVARQAGQHRVGEAEDGRFAARADILHRLHVPAAGRLRPVCANCRVSQSHFCRAVAIERLLCEREEQSMGFRLTTVVILPGFAALPALCLPSLAASRATAAASRQRRRRAAPPKARSWRASCAPIARGSRCAKEPPSSTTMRRAARTIRAKLHLPGVDLGGDAQLHARRTAC